MQEALLAVLQYLIPAIVGGVGTWLYSKTAKGKTEIKASDIENEVKSAAFYQNLLDDASRRLNEAIQAIRERDDIIKQQNARIDELIDQVEAMTGELKKYKQLNGKSHDTTSAESH